MRHAVGALLLISTVCLGTPASRSAEPTDSEARQTALAARLRNVTQTLEANPKDQDALGMRAGLYAALGQHKLAIADYDQLLKLAPQRAEVYDQRGSQRFMVGQIQPAIDDFDRFLQLKPEQEPWHWKRGIAYYYAGRYDEGRRQFEGYQTVDDNDVENAVWRYLCMARAVGVPAARDALLNIQRDTRVPMMEVHALYRGQMQPEDVLAAVRAGSPLPEALHARWFYAHLYLGLYYEVAGNASLAREHITTAAEKYPIDHYMWNVAEIHAQRLKAAAEKPS